MPSFTKEAIKQSFLKLLEAKPLNQITVRDIVEECGINRNSFYYHYADIPTLVTEIITEQANAIIETYASVSSLNECMTAAIQFASGHKRAILHIYRSVNRETVEDYLMQICRHMVEAYVHTAVGEVAILEEDRNILITFCQCECFGQIVAWLNSGMKYDVAAQFSRLCQLMDGMAEELILRCEKAAQG